MDGSMMLVARRAMAGSRSATANHRSSTSGKAACAASCARLRAPRDWNVDKFRFTREQLPPVEYLTRPYFDQWYRCYAAMLLGSGLVTVEELASGRSVRKPAPSLE